MDNMEDSGFDSDPKSSSYDSSAICSASPTNNAHPPATRQTETQTVVFSSPQSHQVNTSSKLTKSSSNLKGINIRRTSELQKKIEKQREVARKSAGVSIEQPRKSLLSMSRLKIPSKGTNQSSLLVHADERPLVAIQSDDSEDEFESPIFSKISNQDITEQLIKDGYNLDLQPDDEDLDLIPPKSFNERCICCSNYSGCVVQ